MHSSVSRVLNASKAKNSVSKFARVNSTGGHPAQSICEEKYIFREHFGELLGGNTCSFESLVAKDRINGSDRFDGVEPSSLPLSLPTVSDLALLYRTLVDGKGFGENRVCTDVFRHFPDLMSRLQYPLIVKVYVRMQPPSNGKVVCYVNCLRIRGHLLFVAIIGTFC
jgi:hypothetical protein